MDGHTVGGPKPTSVPRAWGRAQRRRRALPAPAVLAVVPVTALVGVGLLLAMPAATDGASDEALAALEREVFAGLATARTTEGMAPIQFRSDVLRVARNHSEDMAKRGYFSHYSPEDVGPGERLDAAGVEWTRYGENLARARGARPARAIVSSWLASPANAANILHPNLTAGAVGGAQAEDGTYYLTLLLIKP